VLSRHRSHTGEPARRERSRHHPEAKDVDLRPRYRPTKHPTTGDGPIVIEASTDARAWKEPQASETDGDPDRRTEPTQDCLESGDRDRHGADRNGPPVQPPPVAAHQARPSRDPAPRHLGRHRHILAPDGLAAGSRARAQARNPGGHRYRSADHVSDLGDLRFAAVPGHRCDLRRMDSLRSHWSVGRHGGNTPVRHRAGARSVSWLLRGSRRAGQRGRRRRLGVGGGGLPDLRGGRAAMPGATPSRPRRSPRRQRP